MIGTISPLVQEAPGQWRRSVALHVVGSILGGAGIFGLVAILGWLSTAYLPMSLRWVIGGVLTLVLAFTDLGLLRLPLPKNYHSVPQSWWRQFGPNRGAFAYGFVLGLGITTVIPFAAFYGLTLWVLLLGDPLFGLVVGMTYGFARAVPVLLVSRVVITNRDRSRPHTIVMSLVERIDSSRPDAHMVNGLVMVQVACIALVGVWLR